MASCVHTHFYVHGVHMNCVYSNNCICYIADCRARRSYWSSLRIMYHIGSKLIIMRCFWLTVHGGIVASCSFSTSSFQEWKQMMGLGDERPLQVCGWCGGRHSGGYMCMYVRELPNAITDCEGVGSQFAKGLSCLPQLTINRESGLDVSSPKHGKVPCLHHWQHPCEHLALSRLMQICCMLLFVTVHLGLSREYCFYII